MIMHPEPRDYTAEQAKRMPASNDNKPDFDGAIDYAKRRMKRELTEELTYHSYPHTFDDVFPAAIRLAKLYDLDEYEVGLVAVAAAFHDIGWVIQGDEHEAVGAEIVREVLPAYGFNDDQVEAVAGMIMATRLPQTPNSLLEEIVADADLDVLGREDYWRRKDDLQEEMSARGHVMTDDEWCRQQLQFMESHRYFTEAARSLRGKLKQAHIEELRRVIAQLTQIDAT